MFILVFMLCIVVLICAVVPVAVTQIAQIGNILGKDGNEEE